jgi:hypothetical protein
MTNTGKPYESLTELVLARLLAQDKVCAKVERDVVIVGRSTKHQIDVTFEFIAGPTHYRTIVECKDWASPVDQGEVLEFRSTLDDIPGQPRGIMVSRSGFQDGAKNVARHHGIELYELREPRDEDWEGLLRRIVITVRVSAPTFQNVSFVLDEAWIKEQIAILGIPGLDRNLHIDGQEVEVASESGEPYDLEDGLNAQVPHEPCETVSIRHTFPKPLFVNAPGCPIPKLRVLGIKAEVTVRQEELPQEITASLDHLIAYCFRDVLQGKSRFLDGDGNQVGGHGP